VCNENEKSRQHLVGTASDDLKNSVKVAPEVLARYVGTYEGRLPVNPTPIRVEVTMSGGQLAINGRQLIPTSETTFGGGYHVDFAVNDQR